MDAESEWSKTTSLHNIHKYAPNDLKYLTWGEKKRGKKERNIIHVYFWNLMLFHNIETYLPIK